MQDPLQTAVIRLKAFNAVSPPETSEANLATETQLVYLTIADGIIKIEMPEAFEKATSIIEIISIDGKVVDMRTLKSSSATQINVSSLVSGMYVIRVRNGSKAISKTVTIAS
jgi:hypothetical protein